ncbi:hypothetical protein CFP65_7052 [Kitasatospora sp. MMS16-BH015]|uniref:hypothetical protein n=1 Tax=Kitasatospora sp. MMS16-BH015 TaxID=2018025 RepID=UPI000CA38481|nr:hypothetical protein [Kitasatospora sp. MMS16-BH015]AUG81657.1 hypothetical protein CFP65_7052 [Kitasatospora sp. MMS16-BH015]
MDAREGDGPGRAVRIPGQPGRHSAAQRRPGPEAAPVRQPALVEQSEEPGDAERYAVLGED